MHKIFKPRYSDSMMFFSGAIIGLTKSVEAFWIKGLMLSGAILLWIYSGMLKNKEKQREE